MTYSISNIQTYDVLHQFITWLDSRRLDFIKTKQWLGRFLVTLLLVPFAVIVFSLLRLALKYIFWFVIPKINLHIEDIPSDKNIYIAYRKLYDTINKDLDKLKLIQNSFHNGRIPPLLIRGLVNDLSRMVNLLLNWHTQIEKAFKSMDYQANVSIKPFHVVTEDELWNNRNKAYQYLL
jgi:hypothetical protein